MVLFCLRPKGAQSTVSSIGQNSQQIHDKSWQATKSNLQEVELDPARLIDQLSGRRRTGLGCLPMLQHYVCNSNTVATYGWLSKLWSLFGYPKY